jgi:uncharacterized protein
MAKKEEPKKPNYALYALIIVVVAVAGYFIYTMIADTKKPELKVKPETTEKKEVAEPQFKKQGELEFLNAKNKKLIKKIDIEVADRDSSREKGLMYRKSMDEARGMLFVFPISEEHSFWMKNTVISLDIIFVNENKEIVKIHKSTTPYSTKSLPSEKKSMYVVETVAGFTDKYGIKEGDKMDFQITN